MPPRAVLCVVALLSACHGAAIPVSAPPPAMRPVASAIVLCQTSESELRAQLGRPYRDGRLGPERVVSWMAHRGDPQQFLAVLIDTRGRVVDLYWDIPGAVAWTPINHCASQRALPAQ